MGGLVLSEEGMIDVLYALRVAWLPSLRIGLFQNDFTPSITATISNIVPCTFSGYDGLHAMEVWHTPYLFGDLAVIDADPRLWQHDGGDVQNYVYGYYVVDVSGALRWAERPSDFATPMVDSSSRYSVIPRFAQGSRYPT